MLIQNIKSKYNIYKKNNIFLIGDNIKIEEDEEKLLTLGLGYIETSKYKHDIHIEEIEESKDQLNKTIYSYSHHLKPYTTPSYKFTNEFIEKSSEYSKKLKNMNLCPSSNTIEQLKNRTDIVIKPADKNVGITLIDKDIYIEICAEHLNDPNTYKKLEKDPLETSCKKVKAMLNMLYDNKLIDLITLNKLMPRNTRLGLFYGLLKLHKEKLGLRPIVSQINHPTRLINIYLHNKLEILTKEAFTAIPNSYELTKLLKQVKYNPKLVLITADITSLYTNIPTKWGIKNLLEIYNKYKYKIDLDPIALNIMLYNVLTLNVFEFNNNYFIQQKGTAMGSNLAPTYAGTVLRNLEENWLKRTKYTLELFKRYIDDLFIIYDNTNNSLDEFIDELKTVYDPLELTVNTSADEIVFLDLVIVLDHTSKNLQTKLYKKEIGHSEPLPYSTNHPKHILLNTLSSESLRTTRLTSCPTLNRVNQIKLLQSALKKGYPYTKAHKAIFKKFNKEYSDKKVERSYNRSDLMLTFQGDETNKLKSYLQNTWAEKFPTQKLNISIKLKKNLKRLLTHPKIE